MNAPADGRRRTPGIWELSDLQHYTLSKISAWQALDRAAHLAHKGVLPAKHRDHWLAQRDAIATWVDENCWSEARQAYTFYAGTERLDASLARAALIDFGPPARLHATCDTLRRELGRGPLMYRYTGSDKEEGAFLACSFWLVEAYAHLGRQADAVALMQDLLERVGARSASSARWWTRPRATISATCLKGLAISASSMRPAPWRAMRRMLRPGMRESGPEFAFGPDWRLARLRLAANAARRRPGKDRGGAPATRAAGPWSPPRSRPPR